ncbi:MAG TPA: 6-hydroxymethylpterin diphosphokinase MptE-like protein [Spirochaetota bacterium]|nr:6-hydroxymethylpterin diphosphokinase MptE-like protein [Spirochaetota bacterium]
MTELFEKNSALLKRRHGPVHVAVLGAEDDPRIRVSASRGGAPVPEIAQEGGTISVHSRYDPVTEAARFIAGIEPGNFNLFIVFGFGFAYHLAELLDRISGDAVVLVLEQSAAMIRSAIIHRDLSNMLSDERLHILVDPTEEGLADILRGKSTYRVSFLTHRGSFQIAPAYYSNLHRISKSYLSAKEVNIATLAKFERTWGANIARNAGVFIDNPGAGDFYGKFAGVPAIIAAAGPSLSDSIGFIRANADRAVIVAVDTSYGILKKHGVEPHFCVSVDPQLINARYFEGDTGGRTVLVADPTVHPSVFRLFRGRRALAGMAFPMLKWMEEATGPKGEMAYGGSVSTNAYDFARRLGASTIALVGQDLAFTGGLAHARGSYLDEQVFLRTRRFYTPFMFNRFQLTALPAILVRGIRSPVVHTNQKMMIFLSWFEKRNDPRLVNASFDGARIKGLRHVAAEELRFDGPVIDIFGLIDSAYEEGMSALRNPKEVRRAIVRRCEAMLGELEALVPLLEKAVRNSEELRAVLAAERRDRGKMEYLLKRLAEADRSIESLDALKDMISFTAQRVIHTITEGYEVDEGEGAVAEDERVAMRSRFLYLGFLEGSTFIRKVIVKMLATLDG